MKYISALLLCICLVLSPIKVVAVPTESDQYITILDELGNIVLQTGLSIHPGDLYISEDNQIYKISQVENGVARCEHQGEATLSYEGILVVNSQYAQNKNNMIAIYHTHNDESYIPTDGKPSIAGAGSIFDVGTAMSERLKTNGYQTIHDNTTHEPHDANAYYRSRRTVMKLLKEQPLALFDIHRDSAPLNIYSANINGQEVSKILLVVGRQNQNKTSTLQFAKQAKSAADSKYKGLIRGIFIAHGSYNEDLSPKALLLEIGTQYNTKIQAERSAALFADVIPLFLTISTPSAQASPIDAPPSTIPEAITDQSAYIDDVFRIGIFLFAGILIFLYISTGSWKELKSKFYQFKSKEFGDLFHRIKRK